MRVVSACDFCARLFATIRKPYSHVAQDQVHQDDGGAAVRPGQSGRRQVGQEHADRRRRRGLPLAAQCAVQDRPVEAAVLPADVGGPPHLLQAANRRPRLDEPDAAEGRHPAERRLLCRRLAAALARVPALRLRHHLLPGGGQLEGRALVDVQVPRRPPRPRRRRRGPRLVISTRPAAAPPAPATSAEATAAALAGAPAAATARAAAAAAQPDAAAQGADLDRRTASEPLVARQGDAAPPSTAPSNSQGCACSGKSRSVDTTSSRRTPGGCPRPR